jgi:hypothetical protein
VAYVVIRSYSKANARGSYQNCDALSAAGKRSLCRPAFRLRRPWFLTGRGSLHGDRSPARLKNRNYPAAPQLADFPLPELAVARRPEPGAARSWAK